MIRAASAKSSATWEVCTDHNLLILSLTAPNMELMPLQVLIIRDLRHAFDAAAKANDASSPLRDASGRPTRPSRRSTVPCAAISG